MFHHFLLYQVIMYIDYQELLLFFQLNHQLLIKFYDFQKLIQILYHKSLFDKVHH